MAAVLESVRSDSKIMVNRWLACIPEAHQRCIFVDTLDNREAHGDRTCAGLRESLAWLETRAPRWACFRPVKWPIGARPSGRVLDPPWSEAVIALAPKNAATVLPMYFAGANGPLFQMAGLIHPRIAHGLAAARIPEQARSTMYSAYRPAHFGGTNCSV